MKKIYIWGAAVRGSLAYHYFKDECVILGYVDNDKNKWGKKLNDLTIYSPDVLKINNSKVSVVIAVESKVYAAEIGRQIKHNFEVEDVIHFTFQVNSIDNDDLLKSEEDSILVSFDGGLGNQMFQYVIYRLLELRKKNVRGDLSFYKVNPGIDFKLADVFNNIDIHIANDNAAKEMISMFMDNNNNHSYFQIYKEHVNRQDMTRVTDKGLLNIENGIIKGFHQNHFFADSIRTDLLERFRFDETNENALQKLCVRLKNSNCVSVHIRRGDYLNPRYYNILGDVCSVDYYREAIEFIKKQVDNLTFVFFSDEIEWVKENIYETNSIYIEKDLFKNYQDWYDMCLMSCCNHNIIANSTFSWWGAWLNQSENKIVIAPKVWVKNIDVVDVCPGEWIRI